MGKVNPFGYEYEPKKLEVPYKKDKNGNVYVDKPKFLVDDIGVDYILDEKGKPTGDTVGIVTGQTDLYEKIQAEKENCGLEYILKEVANGRVNPSSLVDDKRINGDFGGDFTNPTMSAEAVTAMAQDAVNMARLQNIAKQLGVSVDELLKCSDINGLVRSKLAPAKEENTNQAKPEEGDK